jgi:energy-coupling factor transporter ATP-binding protein EcfA2
MLKSDVEDGEGGSEGIASRLQIGYQAEREPELSFKKDNWIQQRDNQLAVLGTFFSAVHPQESLCFFYAKRTPLVEDSRRVIVGVGRVLSLSEPVEYKYTTPKPPLRAMLWERTVIHSIRPGYADGFLFPYQEILALAEKDGSINPADFVAFAPEDHFAAFSYVTAHVSHGAAIASLLSCAAALHKIGKHVPGPWDAALVWIDRELNRLWKMRGPFPGFGSALTAFGLPHGSLIAYDIALAQAKAGSEWNEDPWPLFEKILQDPSALSGGLAKELGPSYQKMWAKLGVERKALLKLLARFELGEAQATRFYQETERKKAGIEVKDAQLLANPYLLYELDRTQADAVQFATIDRGMYPDPVVRDKHPVPPPSALDGAVDPRRVRAFVVDELEKRAAQGHTLRPRDWVIQAVRDREVRPACPLGVDVLAVAEEHFAPVVHRARMGDGGEAYQLERLVTTRALVRDAVEKRLKGKRHPSSHAWRMLLDEALPPFAEATDPEQEERARQEKVAALAEIFASRFSVLIGSAGTGKTTLLKVLCDIPEVDDAGILLLAPTGKARVRLEEQTQREGKTIAQFLLGLGRYQGDTGRYFVSGSEKKAADYRTVIIDECSMLTEEQLAAVLDAIEGVQRLILVGDPRQLPPIGAGRPFLDIVRRLAPTNVDGIFPKHGQGYAELTIPRRQAGAARDDLLLAQWFSGRPTGAGADEVWDRVEAGKTDNLRLIAWSTPEELEQVLMVELANELKLAGPDDQDGFEESIGGERFGPAVYFSHKWGDKTGAAAKAEDWQILSPVRAGLHGVESLNRAIQTRFRRRALEWAEPAQHWMRKILKPLGPQRIVYGDKIISVRNGRRHDVWPNPEDKPYIANGDMGIVVGQYKGKAAKFKSPMKLEVEFLSQAGRKVGYWPSDFSDEGDPPLELAYALTVHKTQGSEFKATFVVLPNPCWLLSRELLYTALTRQKDRIVIFHQGSFREFRKFSAGHESETARRVTNLFDAPRPVEVRAGDAKEARFFEEGLIHRTERNHLVRSKSELSIANMLFAKGIKNYHYERELSLEGSKRYPDFTIEDDESGITYYWEHLGMLYDPAYRKRWETKLAWYRRVGILPHAEGGGPKGTLILTQDDEHGGLDTAAVAKIIEEVLKS